LLHFRHRCEAALGGVDQLGALALHLDLDEDRDRVADFCRVDQRDIGADNARLLHTLDTPLHGRRRQVDPLADDPLRRRVVLLQNGQDRAVESVEIGQNRHGVVSQ